MGEPEVNWRRDWPRRKWWSCVCQRRWLLGFGARGGDVRDEILTGHGDERYLRSGEPAERSQEVWVDEEAVDLDDGILERKEA